MDNKYINKLKQCQNKQIKLEPCRCGQFKPEHVKGYIFEGKFYTPEEYSLLDCSKLLTGS